MRRRKEPLLLLLTLLAGAAMIQVLSMRSPGQNSSNSISRGEAVDHIPLVDFGASESTDKTVVEEQTRANRHAVGSHYDKRYLLKRDVDTGGRPVLTNSFWNETLPALPVVRSGLVVLGEVVGADAHLSNDRTGVYSQFTVRVEEVFKDSSSIVFPGGLITMERSGGRVRFPSGRITRYGVAGQDMPRLQQHYVFFLEPNDQQYSIVTAYQVVSGQVHPLDGQNAPGPPERVRPWAGDSYNGANATHFLDEVRKAVAQSPQILNK